MDGQHATGRAGGGGQTGGREAHEKARAVLAGQREEEREGRALEGGGVTTAGGPALPPSARVPVAGYGADSVTATDVPRAHLVIPVLHPSPLDASTSAHTDNPLSHAIRGMNPKDVVNVDKLRAVAERAHVHDHPGATGSA